MLLDEAKITNANHPSYTYGRVHIAQAMVKNGYVKNLQEAFKKYIGNDRPCYVDGAKWSVEEGIALIHGAQGKAVLAHPHLLQSNTVLKK